MYYVKHIAFIAALFLVACGQMADDLNASGADKTGGAQTAGPAPLSNFEYTAINSSVLNMYSELESADALVFYFTMWCPVCDSHIEHMKRHILPDYPGVRFFLVDYVSGSVAQSLASAQAAGLATNARLTVISDFDHKLMHMFDGTMGSTIVIGKDKTIVMNEDFKNGDKLAEVLGGLI